MVLWGTWILMPLHRPSFKTFIQSLEFFPHLFCNRRYNYFWLCSRHIFTSSKRRHCRHRNLMPWAALNRPSTKTWEESLKFFQYLSCNPSYDYFRFGGCYIYLRYKTMSDVASEELHLENMAGVFGSLFISWGQLKTINDKIISGIHDAIIDLWWKIYFC